MNRLRVGSAWKSARIWLAALATVAVMVIAVVVLHGTTAGHQTPVGSMSASSSVSSPSAKPTVSAPAQPSSTVTAPQSSNTVASASGAGTGAVVAPNPTSTGHVPATQTLVIRPVDQAGRPAPGYAVTDLTKGPSPASDVNCGTGPDPLRYSSTTGFPAAVDANIMFCSPGAPSTALACWKAAAPAQALCLQDPWSRQLTQWPAGFTTATRTATAPAHPQPLGLLLSDGEHCLIRYRDFNGRPAQQPTMLAIYLCGKVDPRGFTPGPVDVWAPDKDGMNTSWQDLVTSGIDRSTPSWTVHVGSVDGPLSVRRVITVYYLGTKHL
jgi:hypothetical protein